MNPMNAPAEAKIKFNSGMMTELDSIQTLREKIADLPSSKRFTDEQIEIIYGIGHALYMQGKFDNACGVFQMMLIYRPLDSRILSAFALCCKRLSRFEAAIPAYSAALALDPSNLSLAVHMAECLAALGKREQSLRLLNPLIKLAVLDQSYDALRKRAEMLRDLLETA
jgi:type III secretion system low calcium response chaperone LcrH/SycD